MTQPSFFSCYGNSPIFPGAVPQVVGSRVRIAFRADRRLVRQHRPDRIQIDACIHAVSCAGLRTPRFALTGVLNTLGCAEDAARSKDPASYPTRS